MYKGVLADRMLQNVLSLPDTVTTTMTNSNMLQVDCSESDIFILHQNNYQHVEVPIERCFSTKTQTICSNYYKPYA
jgi:hypothetical protein